MAGRGKSKRELEKQEYHAIRKKPEKNNNLSASDESSIGTQNPVFQKMVYHGQLSNADRLFSCT